MVDAVRNGNCLFPSLAKMPKNEGLNTAADYSNTMYHLVCLLFKENDKNGVLSKIKTNI